MIEEVSTIFEGQFEMDLVDEIATIGKFMEVKEGDILMDLM